MNLETVTKLMALMTEHRIDSVTFEGITITKSKHEATEKAPTDKQLQDRHIQSKEASEAEEASINAWAFGSGLPPTSPKFGPRPKR